MKSTTLRPAFGLTSTQRIACALISVAASTTVCAAVVGLFAQDSATPWLPATPEALALAAACDREPLGTAREACMHRAVAQWQAPQRRELQFASTR